MPSPTAADLQAALDAGDWTRAETIIRETVSQPLSPAETGALYAAVVSAYVTAKNAANAAHLANLQRLTELLADMEAAETEAQAAADLEKLRGDLHAD